MTKSGRMREKPFAMAHRRGRVCRIGADHACEFAYRCRRRPGKSGNSPRRGWSGPCFGCAEHLRIELVADIAAIASLTNTRAAPATADANAAGGTTFAALLQLLQPSAGQISNPTPANDLGQLVAQNDNGAIATVGQTASGQNALANAPVTAATITQSNLIALLQTGDANPPAATGVTTTAPTSADPTARRSRMARQHAERTKCIRPKHLK